MSSRVKQSWVEFGDGFALLSYDLQERVIIEDLCDYADALLNVLQLKELSVRQEMGYLGVFWAYMKGRSLNPNRLRVSHLKDFKNRCLESTEDAPAHRNSRDAAQRTTNAKLVRVYDWLLWMRDTNRVPKTLIGPRDCTIKTALDSSSVFRELSKRDMPAANKCYPLLFRLRVGKSKHALPKTIPTEETLDNVHAYLFKSTKSNFLAQRNCLIADIACYTGFRRGSIHSLRWSQFLGDDFQTTDRDTVILRPSKQKFDYSNTFEIPLWLHEQVKEFLETYWRDFIELKKISKKVHRDALFLSQRSGCPLTDRTMTSLISVAMRSTGATKGASLHAFRFKYAIEETESEYENRAAKKLDTSTESVNRSLAIKLGHSSTESVYAYTARHEASLVVATRAKKHAELKEDKKRILELEDEIARLKAQLAGAT